jgi:peptidoglycan hydrolase-like protein with peptidoglycan-binding domain
VSRAVRIAAVVVLAAAVAGTGAVVYANPRRAGTQAETPISLPTVPVTRGDLTSSVQQPGQLGYTGNFQLVGQRPGTITALPRVGQVIDRGQPVYAVDQRPIPLLMGEVPLFRMLTSGTSGEDVRQLEQNLVDLDLAPRLTVDTQFTAATEAAVKRWQHALGVPETGAVEPGDAVVAPWPVRITSVRPVLGASSAPGQEVATVTSTGHGVHVDLDRRYRSLVAADQRVRVQLFGGRAVDGVVASIGSTATSPNVNNQTSGQQQQQPQSQNLAVDISITSPEAELGGVFEGPVTVLFPGESRRNVLSVPIEALTVLSDGKYAVVVAAAVDGTGRQTVPVTTGLITSSRVEISGVAEGTRVEVPTL